MAEGGRVGGRKGGGQVAVLGILPPGKFVRFITPKASRFEQAESKDFNGF
jgi:hypothetical protein